MGIKKVVKKSKTSVKVGNKQQNKANKKKSNKPGNYKQKKASERGNNVSLEKFRRMKEMDEEDEEEPNENSGNQMPQENGRAAIKRKRFEEVDKIEDCELHYKVKSYIKDGMKERQQRTFALPIKTEGGMVLKNHRKPMPQEDTDEPKPDIKKVKKGQKTLKMMPAEEVEAPKTMLQLIQEKKMSLEKNKEKIAIYSREVLQNPQEEMKKLKELRNMLSYTDVRSSLILRKLIIISLGEIYKDIIPSYKIRSWTAKETEQSMGKDVKALKEYEETLCRQYKLFIDYINDSIKEMNKALHASRNKQEIESWKNYGIVCVKCLSGLLERKSHFNFTPDIIEIIVQQLCHKTLAIAKLANESIKGLYRQDKTLQLSLDITQKITKLLKQKSYGVRGEVLDIFLCLRLKEIVILEEDEKKKMSHKEKQQLSRKDRKQLKDKAQLSKDLEENRVKDSLKSKSKLQTRVLEQIFIVYFNILKKAPNYKLIPSVLEGLARFAHLINLEFFDDIVKLMYNMIESDKLNFRSKLHCIKTVFVVLSGRGESLTIDPMRFYNSLYNIILRIDLCGDLENTTILSECIEMMFFRRRKSLPSARLLAFIKRLGTATLQMDPTSSAIILDILRKLSSLNPNSDLLFDNEYQNSGIYQPEVTQPDHANAQNSAMWELHLLRRHYSTPIKNESDGFVKDQVLTFQDSKRTTQEIIEFMEAEDFQAKEKKIFKSKKN